MFWLAIIFAALWCIQQWRIVRLRRKLDAECALTAYLSEWLGNVRRFTVGVVFENNRYRRELDIAARDLAEHELERDDGDWWKPEGWEAE